MEFKTHYSELRAGDLVVLPSTMRIVTLYEKVPIPHIRYNYPPSSPFDVALFLGTIDLATFVDVSTSDRTCVPGILFDAAGRPEIVYVFLCSIGVGFRFNDRDACLLMRLPSD
jgi:hypothetical protein